MATRSVRFGIGDPAGARSTEWLVLWKTKSSDVYLASRALGNTLKVSLHESGRCHVHGPDPAQWQGAAPPPKFAMAWDVDPQGDRQQLIGIITPVSELRAGVWAPQRQKNTIWITPQRRSAVTVQVCLSRTPVAPIGDLVQCGWHTDIVREQLPNGRYLTVIAGDADLPDTHRDALNRIKESARAAMAKMAEPPATPRLLLLTAPDDNGTRHLVDAAVNDPT